MASYPPALLPKIHPFWITLAYGIFVGYEIRKHDIDGIIKRRLAAKRDEAIKHQANLLLDVAEQRKAGIPFKAYASAEDVPVKNSSPYTADINGAKA